MQTSSFMVVITAVAMGGFLGFLLQKGRFCLNSAFRDIIFVQDLNLFRGYLIAIVVAIIGTNLLEDLGLLMTVSRQSGEMVQVALMRQNFLPVANILGGFIFGLGIVLAGGCASGIVYRLGEGQVAAVIAVIGFFFGVIVTLRGILRPVHMYLKSFTVEVFGKTNPAIWDIFGDSPMAKWGTIIALSTIAIAFVMKGKPTFKARENKKGYTWALTGLLLGVLTIAAWWTSSYFGGAPRGLAITTPLRELFSAVLYRSSHSPFPEFSFLGIFKGTWGVFFIFSVPLGAFLSAKKLSEFKWKIPPATEFLTVFFGSVVMGIGAVMAGGCNLGHGVSGVSTGAVSSFVAISAIILGNWTMVYFKFIKPMEDM